MPRAASSGGASPLLAAAPPAPPPPAGSSASPRPAPPPPPPPPRGSNRARGADEKPAPRLLVIGRACAAAGRVQSCDPPRSGTHSCPRNSRSAAQRCDATICLKGPAHRARASSAGAARRRAKAGAPSRRRRTRCPAARRRPCPAASPRTRPCRARGRPTSPAAARRRQTRRRRRRSRRTGPRHPAPRGGGSIIPDAANHRAPGKPRARRRRVGNDDFVRAGRLRTCSIPPRRLWRSGRRPRSRYGAGRTAQNHWVAAPGALRPRSSAPQRRRAARRRRAGCGPHELDRSVNPLCTNPGRPFAVLRRIS
jgi:hypothetical protein